MQGYFHAGFFLGFSFMHSFKGDFQQLFASLCVRHWIRVGNETNIVLALYNAYSLDARHIKVCASVQANSVGRCFVLRRKHE